MNNYREKKERERILLSSLLVFSAVLFIAIVSFIFNLFQFEDFTEYTGPVKITFGSPDVLEDITTPVKEIVNDVAEPIKDTPTIEPTPEPEPEIIEPTPEIKDPVPTETIKPEPKPIETKKPQEEPKPVTPPEPIIQRGEENGNSHETSFESESNKIGRRAYFPISQFMPLPETISVNLYSLISGDITGMGEVDYNRTFFKRFYSKNGDSYSLKGAVPLQSRPDLWGILESSGYNIDKPEYKENYSLKTVIITFEINSNSSNKNAIKSSKITSSSGVDVIDEAVLYGFNQSTYSNSTKDSVIGRFKYSFK